jgi:hypothetical protein
MEPTILTVKVCEVPLYLSKAVDVILEVHEHTMLAPVLPLKQDGLLYFLSLK